MGWLKNRKEKKKLEEQQNIINSNLANQQHFHNFLNGVNSLKQSHNTLLQENADLKIQIRKLTNEKQKLIDELNDIKRIINGIK